MKEGAKRTDKKLVLTRLETWLTAGIPDLLICDEHGRLHLMELKVTKGNSVDLRPHQVAFLNTHAHALTWVAVKKHPKNSAPEIYLFRGESALDLKVDGLSGVEPVLCMKEKADWKLFWGLISST